MNGYPVELLYENLAQVRARSITVVLEACFSGLSEGGTLVRGASPGALLRIENPVLALDNAVVFAAAAATQVSSWYEEQQHGLFTYFFLKGLQGEADQNRDQQVTAGEMNLYLTENVPYVARRLRGREQSPQMIGRDPNKVLLDLRN